MMLQDGYEKAIPLKGEIPIEKVGGKATNLAYMIGAGFSVPPAFAVSVDVYMDFMERTGLNDRVGSILDGIDYDDDDSISDGAGRIRDLILTQQVPQDLSDAILGGLDALDGAYFAVRSSAVSEDLPDASFAGQHDTFLYVTEKDVVRRTVECWASYWNDRVVKYRHDSGMQHLGVGIGVVVQRMVASEISGVMFTVNPVDGSRNIVVESSWGLGESIASGLITPDKYVLDRDGNILDTVIQSKSKGYFLVDGENRVQDIPEDRVNSRCADDDTLRAIMEQGLALENHFGTPQDVEWAMEGGKVYILQSRSVTTLTDESHMDDLLWSRAYGDEYWADATTPMFFDVMGRMLTHYVNHEGAKMMGYKDLESGPLIKLQKSRVYFNAGVLEKVFAHYPKFIRSKELLNYFPLKDQERISRSPNNFFRAILSQILVMLRDKDGMMSRTDKAYKKWAAGFMDTCKEFDATDLTGLSDSDLKNLFYDVERKATKHYQLIRYGMVSHSILTNLLVKNLLKTFLDDRDGSVYASMISGLDDNKTVSTNIGFSEMAKIVRNDPVLKEKIHSLPAQEFLDYMDSTDNPLKCQFDSFVEAYGHRSNTREFLFPRWGEDRPYIVSVIKLLADEDLDLKKQEESRRQDRLRVEAEVRERLLAGRGGRIRMQLFFKVLRIAQTYLIFRENQRFYLDHILFRQRIVICEFGRRLAERGLIAERDDVFFLFEKELMGTIAGTYVPDLKTITERKMEFYRYQNVLPPKFLKNGIDFDDTVRVSDKNMIHGAASSPGTFTGAARVVTDVRGLSEIQTGEILVTSNTDPGWTAVFSRLGGLVTETGGILSHGAVISREYKIPAVTAVNSATNIIKTGMRIRVDGNDGIVYILEEEE